jgi:hypothetical protein
VNVGGEDAAITAVGVPLLICRLKGERHLVKIAPVGIR